MKKGRKTSHPTFAISLGLMVLGLGMPAQADMNLPLGPLGPVWSVSDPRRDGEIHRRVLADEYARALRVDDCPAG